MSTTSLRERSKAKRRTAIQRAAVKLFAERGYDRATIADIAQQAELAPRTVSLYFPAKIDIAMSLSGDIAARLTATIRDHPELTFTGLVDLWLAGESQSMDPELAAMTAAMFDANPGLRAASTTNIAEAARIGSPAMSAEIGRPDDDPMFPIIHATITAAVTEYFAIVLKSGSTPELHRAFMRYLRSIVIAANPYSAR